MKNELNIPNTPDEDVTAKAIVGYLNETTKQIDDNTLDNLAKARAEALNAYARATQSAGHETNGLSATLRLFTDFMHQHRLLASSAMALSVVLAAIVFIQPFSSHENYGQGDAFLLGSDLPPEAYYDKGFDTWLERSS